MLNQKHNSILLFSGGLDSFIAWHYLNHPPVLFMDAGQSYAPKELKTVKYFARKYPKMKLCVDRSLDLSTWEEKNFYIPYRNVLFSLVASLYAPTIYLVGIKGDSVVDNNPNATRLMSKFFPNFNATKNMLVTSPFYKMSKSRIVKWYLDQGLPLGDLLRTRSCYDKDSAGQCGKCGSCFRRWVALENNNIREQYDSPPWKWIEVKKYIRKIRAGHYDKERAAETLQALSKYIKL